MGQGQQEPGTSGVRCPSCSADLTWITQFGQYYCAQCRRYYPPSPLSPQPQYFTPPGLHYPHTPPSASPQPYPIPGTPAAPFPPPYSFYPPRQSQESSPQQQPTSHQKQSTCQGPIVWVPQYQRYYCESCKAYV